MITMAWRVESSLLYKIELDLIWVLAGLEF